MSAFWRVIAAISSSEGDLLEAGGLFGSRAGHRAADLGDLAGGVVDLFGAAGQAGDDRAQRRAEAPRQQEPDNRCQDHGDQSDAEEEVGLLQGGGAVGVAVCRAAVASLPNASVMARTRAIWRSDLVDRIADGLELLFDERRVLLLRDGAPGGIGGHGDGLVGRGAPLLVVLLEIGIERLGIGVELRGGLGHAVADLILVVAVVLRGLLEALLIVGGEGLELTDGGLVGVAVGVEQQLNAVVQGRDAGQFRIDQRHQGLVDQPGRIARHCGHGVPAESPTSTMPTRGITTRVANLALSPLWIMGGFLFIRGPRAHPARWQF